MGGAETSPMAELETLLDRELVLIRRADFAQLGELSSVKEALLEALSFAPAPTPESLERLRGKARRVASSLESARQGLRAAGRRVAELQAAGRPATYDAEGHRSGLCALAGRIERRA